MCYAAFLSFSVSVSHGSDSRLALVATAHLPETCQYRPTADRQPVETPEHQPVQYRLVPGSLALRHVAPFLAYHTMTVDVDVALIGAGSGSF